MGHHTFDAARADSLEAPEQRYRHLSREELLWALAPESDQVVADLGSGTGFYTDDVAPHTARTYAVDVQSEMHEYYRDKGVPENVTLVTSGIASLPFGDGALDGAFSTMTYHEFVSDEALAEVERVLAADARLVVVDWGATGTGDQGPPVAERFSAEEAAGRLEDSGFEVSHQAVRPETFLLVATPAR